MFNITINIKPTNTTTNITIEKATEEKTKRSRLWLKIATWATALAGTIAVASDIVEIIEKFGLL